jgi:hypothetical protein
MDLPRALLALAGASVDHYDGTAGALVDTNVWVDCIDKASPWHGWVIEQRQTCSECAALHVSTVNYS